MTGEVHWLPLAILGVSLIPVVLLFIREFREDRKYRVEHERVRCRARNNQLVNCTLVRDAGTGQPIGIRECTAWAGPEGSHCDQSCLPLFSSTQPPAAAQTQKA